MHCNDYTYQMQIYKFKPILKTVIWGGDKIAKSKGIADAPDNVGESWELSGVPGSESVVADGPESGLTINELISKHKADLLGHDAYAKHGDKFPLLIKFIDANHNLSVQVHPNDELARKRHNCPGKTEMWYIIDALPKSKIYSGFSKPVTAEDYPRLVADGRIMDAIASYEAASGDVFFLPSGRVHAIGEGIFLAEIQQNSDITYRIYDYNRLDANGKPRQLHTDQARDAIDYSPCYTGPAAYDRSSVYAPLVDSPQFKVSKYEINGRVSVPDSDSFVIAICLKGNMRISAQGMDDSSLSQFETALIPACARQIEFSGNATLLVATL